MSPVGGARGGYASRYIHADVYVRDNGEVAELLLVQRYRSPLYGYHRMENPPVVYAEDGTLKITQFSNIEQEEGVVVSIHGREDDMKPAKQAGLRPVEPVSY